MIFQAVLGAGFEGEGGYLDQSSRVKAVIALAPVIDLRRNFPNADIEAMKRQIHAYKGHEDIAVEGHNVKLGRGGIREVEFFVQTQQLIAGGRHPELRGRETLPMLDAMVEGGWIKKDARADLRAAYEFLRHVEHRLQMVADDQTHTLPLEREDIESLSYAMYRTCKTIEKFAERFNLAAIALCFEIDDIVAAPNQLWTLIAFRRTPMNCSSGPSAVLSCRW